MNIVKCTYIIDGNQGQYIPQIFAERYPEWLEDDDKAILLSGPDHADYWEVWNDVQCSEHDGQFLTNSEGGNDLMLCTESPMQWAVLAFAEGEKLEDCPEIIRPVITVLCNEFLTDPEGWQSEEEALLYFAPSQYNTPDVNKACKWIQAQLKEAIQ